MEKAVDPTSWPLAPQATPWPLCLGKFALDSFPARLPALKTSQKGLTCVFLPTFETLCLFQITVLFWGILWLILALGWAILMNNDTIHIFLPDGRQTIKDGVSRFCVWLLWGVEFIWKGTPFMFWLTAGTGGGGLVELRGLSLDWLWSLMPLRRLTERRGASQPAPKQVVKSGSWEESAVLACCLSGANHPSVFPTLYFWDVQGDFFTLGLPWKVKVWKT